MSRATRQCAASCEGKQRHATQSEAVAHLISLKRSVGYRGRTYHCRFCGFWHVGYFHPKKRRH